MRMALEALKLVFSARTPLKYTVYMKSLQLCIDANAKKGGLLIHHHLVTSGYNLNLHLSTKLIIFYAKFQNMVAARNIFSRMAERNVVSWTAMLSGFSQNGYFQEAYTIFLTMHQQGVKANQFTYGSVLRACTSMRCLDRGRQIHGCVQKCRFVENLFVQSALVDFHSKCGKMEDACRIFKAMSERDLICWNAMIGGYAVQELPHDSFQMFRAMLMAGMLPDCFTFVSILKSLAGGRSPVMISQIHGLVVHLGYGSYSDTVGSLIDAYSKCGRIDSAVCLYKNLHKKDLISCTSLISGYARSGNCSRDAFDLFLEIHHMYLEMDGVIFCSMFSICANLTSLDLGRQIHGLAYKTQSKFDVAMGNALIDMYAKCGEIEDARLAFDQMEERTVITWTSLIAGYGLHGYGHEAVALYENMVYHGIKPNDITFLCLLISCSHAGLIVEGQDYFVTLIGKYNILPRPEHYSCMVDLFARGGQLEEAHNVLRNMSTKTNASTWGAILSACKTHDNVSLGEVAARHLLKLDTNNSAGYVALASIYAAAGLWDNALSTRQSMQNRSSKKDAGYSLLQSRNAIAQEKSEEHR